ncbi:hypothetical protein C8J57DRAFT_1253348 [Mycena rebaudengoi]|nr:hypothetical protein C8J57DRAFT_1253348 [Mycena rebaudengoi]
MSTELADEDLEHVSPEEFIQLAIAAIKASNISECKAAMYYCVPCLTVQGHRKDFLLDRKASLISALTLPQQDVLNEWVKVMGKRGFPLTLNVIGTYTSKITGASVSATWAKHFKECNLDLKVKWATGLEECHARALNPAAVHECFSLLIGVIDQYDIKFENIYDPRHCGLRSEDDMSEVIRPLGKIKAVECSRKLV